MKLLVAGGTVVALGLLTAGCSGGSGTKAAASATAGGTSAAATAAPSPSGVATSPAAASAAGSAAGSTAVSSAAPPASSSTVAQPTAAATDVHSATTAPPAAASSATTGGTTGGTAAPVAVCTLLPTSQVASLSGRALTSSREQDFAADNAYTCAYYTASGVGGLSITVTVVGGAAAYQSFLTTDTAGGAAEHATPLTGIGDKAFSARDGVHVLFGDRMDYVAGLTSVQPAEAIIEAVQAKIK